MTVTDRQGVEFAWDVGGTGLPDLQAVDVVARLTLLFRRDGASVRLTEVSAAMSELLVLSGLTAEVRCQDRPGPDATQNAGAVPDEGASDRNGAICWEGGRLGPGSIV